MSDFTEAFDRFNAETQAAIEREATIRMVESVASCIAWLARVPPHRALGWTRRRWVRARKLWNAQRRIPTRWAVVSLPGEQGEVDQAMEDVVAALRTLDDWRAVNVDPGTPVLVGRRFTPWPVYVGECIARGGVPRYRRWS